MTVTDRLREVFASIFGVSPADVTDATTPDTLDAWDSVHHIQLVMAVEAEFGMQFDPGEIAELTSFGALRTRIETGAAHG